MISVTLFAKGTVEEFDDVQNLLAGAMDRGAGSKLQDAAGIHRNDCLPPYLARLFHFLR
jgi:hypothetical protein